MKVSIRRPCESSGDHLRARLSLPLRLRMHTAQRKETRMQRLSVFRLRIKLLRRSRMRSHYRTHNRQAHTQHHPIRTSLLYAPPGLRHLSATHIQPNPSKHHTTQPLQATKPTTTLRYVPVSPHSSPAQPQQEGYQSQPKPNPSNGVHSRTASTRPRYAWCPSPSCSGHRSPARPAP